MRISVIILTGNEQIHIQRCLEKIAPLAHEVFVVDSFSSDRTHEIVENFTASLISPSAHSPSAGLADGESGKSDFLSVSASAGCRFSRAQHLPSAGGAAHGSIDAEGNNPAHSQLLPSAGVHFVQNKWPGNQALQFNWVLDNLPITGDWILRLDADEYLTPELISEIQEKLPTLDTSVSGIVLPLRRVFLGRTIQRGMPQVQLLRLFRTGKGRCEERMMDEHIQLIEGETIEFTNPFADDNLNNLSWWTQKHIGYALREATDLLDIEYDLFSKAETKDQRPGSPALCVHAHTQPSSICSHGTVSPCPSKPSGNTVPLLQPQPLQTTTFSAPSAVCNTPSAVCSTPSIGEQAAAKRAQKLKYARLPLFWRAFAYFCLRYFIKGGFLEGKEGFLWHFLQGLWYRTLVDAKVWEIKRKALALAPPTPSPAQLRSAILTILREDYQMKI